MQTYVDYLNQLMTGGLQINGLTIKCKSPLSIRIEKQNDGVNIDFVDNYPLVTYKQNLGLISPQISTYMTGVVFKQKNGIIKLKNFIDIPFNYE